MSAGGKDCERIVALALAGVPPRRIAVQVDRPVNTVSYVLTAARKRGIAVPRFTAAGRRPSSGMTLTVPPHVLDLLRPHAERRHVSLRALIRDVLLITAEAALVDAILDDGTVTESIREVCDADHR
ncbi:hypothetical protein DDZ14_16240 [Maritimibacter sp. 55A14]|uniref:hypothetical protein n=1 Tax=Maritimibacter sp. 55A14 TaxID=2174844 RepID=UPI000D61558C|nr:hypothetical protein [Maritimibacter sp. 55A14]PWE29989.1 hypothetical protein DDZ14_16240 [Maritimibacter sp. 55A14]